MTKIELPSRAEIAAATTRVFAVIGFVMLSSHLASEVFGGVPLVAFTPVQSAVLVLAWRWSSGRWPWQPAQHAEETPDVDAKAGVSS